MYWANMSRLLTAALLMLCLPGVWSPSSLGVNFMRHELAEQLKALIWEMNQRSRKRATHKKKTHRDGGPK